MTLPFLRHRPLALAAAGLAGCLCLAGIAICAVDAFNAWRYQHDIGGPDHAQAPSAQDIAKGRYLATAGDCVACHSLAGQAPFAGGLKLDTGFGLVAASNITPDRETGIGGWTTKQFILAVREGVGDHGERLYPAMPYNDYAKVSDADLAAIKAYLDTVPAARHKVVANLMPFPFNIRLMMLGWNFLFFDNHPFRPDPTQSAEWNRGAYLVEGLGHCTACHTSKNVLGGDLKRGYLNGQVLQGWYAPNITNAPRDGLQSWSIDDIAAYLKTGGNAHAVAAGPMAEAVAHSTQYLSEADLHAIAVYLKSLPGTRRPHPSSVPQSDPAMRAGRTIYVNNCAACHAASGDGVPGMVTALRQGAGVQAPLATNIIRTVLVGERGGVTVSNPTGAAMPAFSWKLTDAEVADVSTYIRNSWGNQAGRVEVKTVRSARRSLKARPAEVAPAQ